MPCRHSPSHRLVEAEKRQAAVARMLPIADLDAGAVAMILGPMVFSGLGAAIAEDRQSREQGRHQSYRAFPSSNVAAVCIHWLVA
jgi:hypothetical protein